MWEQHISIRPLLLINDIIDVTRRCAASAQGGWDTPQTSLVKDMELVCNHAEGVLLTFADWRTAPQDLRTNTVVAASDSSKRRGGYIVWSADRKPMPPVGWFWSDAQLEMHIFIKELLAATILIETLCQTYRHTTLKIGIDNSAAAWCLRRLFSTTHHGQELIRRVYNSLVNSGDALDIVQRISACITRQPCRCTHEDE